MEKATYEKNLYFSATEIKKITESLFKRLNNFKYNIALKKETGKFIYYHCLKTMITASYDHL